MKVLWITNIMLPPICEHLHISSPVVGGWMYSSAKAILSLSTDVKLAVATIYNGKELKKVVLDNIVYYLLPIKGSATNYHNSLEPLWKKVNNDFHPDLVHLHGTEYSHGLAFLRACPEVKSVVSIQGLVSVYARYYLDGMTSKDINSSITFRDVLRGTLRHGQSDFYRRGEYEKEIIRRVHHIIGRTSWDRAQTWAINPKAEYHYCNETLRNPFYEHKWSYVHCEPHTIFISQAGYPIKGLHQLLKAMPLIMREFPDVKVYVAGGNIIDTSSFIKRLKFYGYGKYIKKLINKYSLKDRLVFTGFLDENKMCEYYLRSNLFVCPSSIENSPNSLGEAQLLGMPCIASYVGGVPDMMKGFEEWTYRFEEVEMLAEKVCKVFRLEDHLEFHNDLSLNRHNKNKNSSQLYEIYSNIINK